MNNELLSYYRGCLEYLKRFENDKKHSKLKSWLSGINSEKDTLDATHLWCEIETDWIEIIENGLPYIEKAIAEERQFILNDGDVVPIENAKRVSRASVVHLARHSELITHERDDDKLIPDKIFIKENVNNYHVYENRFLYMILSYLRDFVDIRYNKIIESNNTYKSRFSADRLLKQEKREMYYRLEFSEKRSDDENVSLPDAHRDAVKRIESIRFLISAYLRTDLMTVVAKAPMLRPPITQTNILKMDTNFRETYKLFEAISSYDKPGYQIREQKVFHSPLPENISDELSESIMLTSFLVYLHGNSLEKKLGDELHELQQEEADERFRQKQEHLAKLREKQRSDPGSLPELVAQLEEYVSELEKERDVESRKAIIAENNSLKEKNKALMEDRQLMSREMADMQERYYKLTEESELALKNQNQRFETEKEEINSGYQAEISDMNKRFESDKEDLKKEIERLKSDVEKTLESNAVLSARLHAVFAGRGEAESVDYSSEEGFSKLKKEREAFEKFFESHWKGVKKDIRKKYLWSKTKDEGQNGEDDAK